MKDGDWKNKDVDKVFDHETLEEKAVSAPKTIDRLEEISKMRTAQRKAEDDEDEDAFKISDADSDIDLGIVAL